MLITRGQALNQVGSDSEQRSIGENGTRNQVETSEISIIILTLPAETPDSGSEPTHYWV